MVQIAAQMCDVFSSRVTVGTDITDINSHQQ